MAPRWGCVFTSAAFALSIQYGILFCIVSLYLWRLLRNLPRYKRQPQKLFLLLSLLQVSARAWYLTAWPLLHTSDDDPCSPISSGADSKDIDSPLMNILGTLPSCLFLSAFSVNVFTFARVYHTVLRSEQMTFTMSISSLAAVNILVWFFTIFGYFITNTSDSLTKTIRTWGMWSVSICSLIVALGFFAYGVLLYLGVRKKQVEILAPFMSSTDSNHHAMEAGTPPSSGAHQREGSNDGQVNFKSLKSRRASRYASLIGPLQPPPTAAAFTLPPNPMKKLLIVSTICMLCFLCRTVLLPSISLLLEGDFGSFMLPIYFEISEIIPLALMLYIFEGRSPEDSDPSDMASTENESEAHIGSHYQRLRDETIVNGSRNSHPIAISGTGIASNDVQRSRIPAAHDVQSIGLDDHNRNNLAYTPASSTPNFRSDSPNLKLKPSTPRFQKSQPRRQNANDYTPRYSEGSFRATARPEIIAQLWADAFTNDPSADSDNS